MNLNALMRYAKSKLILLSLLLTCLTAQSQVTLKIGEFVEQQGDEVTVSVTAYGFSDMLGMQFSINWDPGILQFVSVGDFNLDDLSPGLFGTPLNGTAPGVLTTSWLDNNLQGISVPDGTAIFNLTFIKLTDDVGFIAFSGSPTPILFVDEQENLLDPTLCYGQLADKTIFGQVFNDQNSNCTIDSLENGLEGWIIQIADFENYFARTNENGQYWLPAGLGTYEVTISPPNDYWGICTGSYQVTVDDLTDTVFLDIPAQPLTQCPLLEVDVATTLLRRCFDNTYVINYRNKGAEKAEDAFVEVTFDPFLEVLGSDLPWTDQNGQTYTFQLGDIEVGEFGTFRVDVHLPCEGVVLGQTHCVTAHIFPDSICKPENPDWSGANIVVNGFCDADADSVRFFIENIGDGDMPEPAHYIVVEDAVMFSPQPYSLNSGESREITMKANGSTFRIEADQVFGHPVGDMPSLSIEGCGAESDSEFVTGFVNQFAQNDESPFISIDCRENIGSYDPNDKLAFPKGALEPRYIEPNTELEYIIRFQNTGTDTAFNVLIRDTLSSYLDITQIRPGSSSHPYRLELLNDRELLVFFDQIMLPDSIVNEPASHGFVKFRIPQQDNNPLGSLIENRAAIYFDFNDPVITNTSFHTIGESFLEIVSSNPTDPKLEVKIDIYPNPFTEKAVFEIEGPILKDCAFLLYRSDGMLLETIEIENNQWDLPAQHLASGWYFYHITQNNQSISQGKLIKH